MEKNCIKNTIPNEKGAILAIVLIFLLVLSLLGLSALNMSELQLRMSHNFTDNVQELHAAEAGLKEAESELTHVDNLACFAYFDKEHFVKPWLNSEFKHCSINFSGQTVNYFIEQLPGTAQTNIYQVTAWATGSDALPTVLQSTYALVVTPTKDINQRRLSWREIG